MNAYQVLGIESDADERTIKRAYASLIKQYRPDTHAIEFARIRSAYEDVLRWLHTEQQQEAWQQVEENVASTTETVELITEHHAPATESTFKEPASQHRLVEHKPIKEHIAELERIAAQGCEQAALSEYLEQSANMAEQLLDQQLEYERALLNWVLVTQHPSLLVFAEASKRYRWESEILLITRQYGEYAGIRLYSMYKLLRSYEDACKQNNPFIQINGLAVRQQPRIFSHYSKKRAEQYCANWLNACEAENLSSLSDRLCLQSTNKPQLYWIDLFIGLLSARIAWSLVKDQYTVSGWLIAISAGLAATFLPMFVRRVLAWINSRPMKLKALFYKNASKFFMVTIIILMFAAGKAGNAEMLLLLIAIMVTSFMAEVSYEFLASLEMYVTHFCINAVRLILWLGKAIRIIVKSLFKFSNTSSANTYNDELHQFRMELLVIPNMIAQFISTRTNKSTNANGFSLWIWVLLTWMLLHLMSAILK